MEEVLQVKNADGALVVETVLSTVRYIMQLEMNLDSIITWAEEALQCQNSLKMMRHALNPAFICVPYADYVHLTVL